ncbi:NADH-quinone oxidoreductase subunit I [Candidatus Geothermarchaeota archaeon]|nr:MAG: NADH-quinone oxidoreductase subunit I [Candidatus Geothermarchaeota archaeon]RLG62388.1 MAG: NADH-quinone oxidoreductase subunit I [Candidatus Geothermarchaeota archaeon]HEW93844.1 NADH-quinone oxidoreductase subunit I [Thermoprotei archaeon]
MAGKNFLSRVVTPFFVVLKHVVNQPVTHKYPYERLKGFDRTRGRIVLDIERCIGCGACGWICPDSAIQMKFVEGSKVTHPAIDFLKCSFCGLCVEICPREALKMTNVVELAEDEYRELVYTPEKLSIEPNLKDILPMMKYELEPVITPRKMGYSRRRIEK